MLSADFATFAKHFANISISLSSLSCSQGRPFSSLGDFLDRRPRLGHPFSSSFLFPPPPLNLRIPLPPLLFWTPTIISPTPLLPLSSPPFRSFSPRSCVKFAHVRRGRDFMELATYNIFEISSFKGPCISAS